MAGQNVQEVTLGLGVLELNGVDVGFLKDSVELNYTADVADFKSQIPLTTLIRVRTAEDVKLSATVAQVNATMMKNAVGTGIITDSPTEELLEVGGDSLVPDIPLVFTHTRRDGKIVEVTFYKASSNEMTLPFTETDFSLYDVEFTGIGDLTKAAGKNQFKIRNEKPAS